MRLIVLLIFSLITSPLLMAQRISEPQMIQMITDACPACISGDSITPYAATLRSLTLVQDADIAITNTKGLEYFTDLDSFTFLVKTLYGVNYLPPNNRYFYFRSSDAFTFLGWVDFSPKLNFMHLDGIIGEGLDYFPESLRTLEFGYVGDSIESYFGCLPSELEICRNLVDTKLIVPNKPKTCTFEGNLAVDNRSNKKSCPNSYPLVIIDPFKDLNCNGIWDINEPAIENYELRVEPIDTLLHYGNNSFLANTNQTFTISLTPDQPYQIYPNGADYVFTTEENNLYLQLPLCVKPTYYSSILGRVYHDTNKNQTKDSTEAYLPNIKMKVTPTGDFITSSPQGLFTFGGDSAEVVNIDLSLPSSDMYLLPTGPIIATLPSQRGDTTDLGNIPLWDKKAVYDAEINLMNVGGTARNTNKIHQLKLVNTGRTDLKGTLTWTLKNWKFNNFYAFNVTPDEIIHIGDDFTLIYRNLELKENETITLFFTASLVQERGVLIEETAHFQTDTGIDIKDKISYEIAAPFDPNYIEVNHERISGNFINTGERLKYTLHFQNMGSAPAKNVVIFNYITSLVDLDNFKIIGVSFPPELEIYNVANGRYLLKWTFNGIHLPAAEADSIGSMGYVSYRIGLSDSLQERDEIEAGAEIVFDTELPILTNLAKTVYYCPQMDQINFAHPMVDFFKCYDGEAKFIVNVDSVFLPLTGKWSDREEFSLENRIFTTAGNYFYTIEDEAVCRETWQITLKKPDSLYYSAVLSDSLLHIIVSGGTSPYIILWKADNTTGEFKNISRNGRYEFTITDFNGCQSTGEVEIHSLATATEQQKEIYLYPQPANEILFFHSSFEGMINYRILNELGQQVGAGSTLTERGINIGNLPSGLYILTLHYEGVSTRIKWIKN